MEIVDFKGAKMTKEDTKPKTTKYEFHLHRTVGSEDGTDELVLAEGFLKFGPQFVAVVNGPEDTSDVSFAVATPLIKYVKRLGADGQVEGTLSLS